MPKNSYGNEKITQLKGADRVRLRPAVIFGSDGIEGCRHSMFEILSNSVDEAREGFGKKIIVTRFLDHSIQIEDFGRGIPMDYNESEKEYNWKLVFCELYAGGKYDTNSQGSYKYSLGLNGLGLAATQYSSAWMYARVKRDGFIFEANFEKGQAKGKLKKEEYKGRETGSLIRWLPDLDVFTDIDIDLEYYQTTLKRQAVVNANITFILKNEISKGKFETFEYKYENGIKDYVNEIGGKELITKPQFWQAEKRGRDRKDMPDYNLLITACVAFSKTLSFKEYYHNSSFLEHGGAPEKAVKSAFLSQADQYIKQSGKYLKTDKRITYQDIEDCLVIVISSFSTQTSYENQTKKAITNKFIQEAMTEFFKHQLEIYFLENKLEADAIAEQILINMRSRVRAESARKNIKKVLQNNIDMTNRVKKFVDCRSKNKSERELFIVEGDSALGSCKQARDSNFQAIMPVRGKILNCLKADYNRIFKSDIIVDLIKVLGCGVEVKSSHVKDINAFDFEALRWDKIIICTDADVDGFQIRTLILTMIYRLMPTLIKEGKIYIAESPLYEINAKKETYFCYNEEEKTRAIKALGDEKYTVQRSKGLGENDADMMWLTTMGPETRRLIKVSSDEVVKTAEVFELLLGDNIDGRKKHIEDNGYKYIEMTDVS
ncbi:MAG: toprim domain-containing protein [Clostridia bacterium]|nr:toprim domain-containing protein [Clostridia bacterium]